MGLWNARQVWAAMPKETRLRAALALWEDERLDRDERQGALAPWLAARGIRGAFLEKMPRPRRAELMASGGLAQETAYQVLLSYHFRHHAAMLARFLDLLEIQHEGGLINEEIPPVAADKVQAAVTALRAEFEPADVETYLRTLTATDPITWDAVGALVDDPS